MANEVNENLVGGKLKMKYLLSKTIKEYADSTTIHGINYIFQSGISVIERLLWIAAVITGIYFALNLSVTAYIDWVDNPVITTVTSTGKPIKEIEFPAITICAQANISQFLKNDMHIGHTNTATHRTLTG